MTQNPYIDIHTHTPTNNLDIKSIINWDETEFGHFENSKQILSLGLHPWNISKVNLEFTLDKIEEYSSYSKILAIGEIGLDRFAAVDMKIQKKIFTTQLQIANQVKKPVIIHCVRSFPELLRIRKEQKTSIPWIIHGYRNNEQIANSLLRSRCYLSFGKALLEQEKVQFIFQNIPDHQYFLETDDSTLNIIEIYQKAASLKNRSVNAIKQCIQINYHNCFKLL